MRNKVDLIELLKNSIGEKFWTYMHGEVILSEILFDKSEIKFLCSKYFSNLSIYTNRYGEYQVNGGVSYIFPSETNLDWSKWKR